MDSTTLRVGVILTVKLLYSEYVLSGLLRRLLLIYRCMYHACKQGIILAVGFFGPRKELTLAAMLSERCQKTSERALTSSLTHNLT